MDAAESPLNLDQALDALRQTVDQLFQERQTAVRPPVVKGRLRELLPSFNEAALGFLKFSEFLKRAAEANIIALTPSAPDYLITPAGVSVPSRPPVVAASSGRAGRPIRLIRTDLWHAFVHSGDYLRFYDRTSDTAYCLPTHAPPQESPPIVAVREAYAASPDDFIPIQPISEQAQREWAKSILESNPTLGLSQTREAVLDPGRPFSAVSRLLSADETIRRQWHGLRFPQVATAIRAWCQEHGLHVDILAEARPKDATSPNLFAATSAPPSISDLEGLRALIKQAIELMPARDLLSLPIPLEYVLRAGRK